MEPVNPQAPTVGWSLMPYKVANKNAETGERQITPRRWPGLARGSFVISDSTGQFDVTHLGSGYLAGRLERLHHAVQYAEAIELITDWTKISDKNGITPEIATACKKVKIEVIS